MPLGLVLELALECEFVCDQISNTFFITTWSDVGTLFEPLGNRFGIRFGDRVLDQKTPTKPKNTKVRHVTVAGLLQWWGPQSCQGQAKD